MQPVRAAILTGGASRRMGRDKALLAVDGVAMARRVADVVQSCGCDPVVAIGGDAAGLAGEGLVCVPDRWPGAGPLGGILTALSDVPSPSAASSNASTDTGPGPVLVVATDLPFLDRDTVQALLAWRDRVDVDVVVARSERLEPLCGLWWPSSAVLLGERFAAGERAVHRAMADLRRVEVAVAPDALRNVNAPDDLD